MPYREETRNRGIGSSIQQADLVGNLTSIPPFHIQSMDQALEGLIRATPSRSQWSVYILSYRLTGIDRVPKEVPRTGHLANWYMYGPASVLFSSFLPSSFQLPSWITLGSRQESRTSEVSSRSVDCSSHTFLVITHVGGVLT